MHGTYFPEESALCRREKIYNMAILLFAQGEHYESAIHLGEALCRQFKNVTHEYTKLAKLLHRLGDWYEKIENSERYQPTVYRVGYYGKHYPAEVRNMQFVYRGAPLEQIMDFSVRIKARYPDNQVLALKIDPSPEQHFEADKYLLQINKLHPIELTGADAALPPKQQAFKLNNGVDTFYYTRPYNKRKQMGKPKTPGQAGEFLDLWVEKIIVKVETKMPNTQRRVPIVSQEVVFLNPIEMALDSLRTKNEELTSNNSAMELLPNGGADQSFTMALYGVVDSPVNGGLIMYRTMINGEYRTENPEILEDLEARNLQHITDDLVQAVQEQIAILDNGVRIHSTKVCPEMEPLSRVMETKWVEKKNQMDEILSEATKFSPLAHVVSL